MATCLLSFASEKLGDSGYMFGRADDLSALLPSRRSFSYRIFLADKSR
jgi:hypothetical protein